MSVKKLLLISILIITALAVPLTIYIVQKQQQTQSNAQASTTLKLTPSPITKNVGDTMQFNIEIDPGSNLVFAVSLDITYDPTKLEPASGTDSLVIPSSVFPQVSPVAILDGHIRVVASAATNQSAVISQPKTLGTITMRAIGGTGSTPTKLDFGSQTYARSSSGSFTGSSDDSAGENIISSTSPALITIAGSTTGVTPSVTVPPVSSITPPTLTPTLTPTRPPAATATLPIKPTATLTPTAGQTASNPTVTSTSDLLANGPTSTTTNSSGNVNSNSSFISNTPAPTLDATGPGLTFIGFGAIVALLTIIGSILFFAL